MVDNFSHNSSSAFSTDDFASVRKKAEKQTIKCSSDNAEVYNRPLSMEELQDTLRRAHDTSAGPDEIHYQLLKHLPSSSLLLLLNIFNKIWLSGDFPSDWRKAIIIPIPKPGKDPTNPTNYRPIALTSCICKTMERVINRRLVSSPITCLLTCNVGSDPDVALLIILLDLKRFSGKLSSISSTWFRCSLIWRKLMTPLGSMGL